MSAQKSGDFFLLGRAERLLFFAGMLRCFVTLSLGVLDNVGVMRILGPYIFSPYSYVWW